MEENPNVAKKEFEKYLKKHTQTESGRYANGIDVGCGTARVDEKIISVDQQPDERYAHAQLVHNCHDLNIFSDGSLDFIFSSHCIEDFEDIPVVFKNWWDKLKVGGKMLLLLPDMEKCECEFCNGKEGQVRYPTVEMGGNPSHRTNVGKKYINSLLQSFAEKGEIKYKMLQMDTIPHNETSSIDFAIEKIL
jgi:predicted SAM-dependent methyltransferase